MTIEETLVTKYGPLMSVTALSSVLDRSPESVRVFLRSNGESAQRLNLAKVKVGRRLYFRTAEIAQVLNGQ
ncbi:MAG TPA: plasmid-related protein [Janthinobacterium sp.]|nr:plasmid-related protein [Janthinobacterium sp.]